MFSILIGDGILVAFNFSSSSAQISVWITVTFCTSV